MPRIAKAHIVPDYRPLVKDVVKLLRSHGAVPMPADVRRRLKKAGMLGMPAEEAFSLATRHLSPVTSRQRLVSAQTGVILAVYPPPSVAKILSCQPSLRDRP